MYVVLIRGNKRVEINNKPCYVTCTLTETPALLRFERNVNLTLMFVLTPAKCHVSATYKSSVAHKNWVRA